MDAMTEFTWNRNQLLAQALRRILDTRLDSQRWCILLIAPLYRAKTNQMS